MNQEGIPKIFISYSWSSQTHINWVIELAKKLMGDGVNVVLDKWELKEGRDSHHFMEQMVNDDTISRVLIIVDKIYSEKANDRSGGVGIETHIITPEIYNKYDQGKFIPVIRELQKDGKPYLPTYLKGRIYIEFATDENFLDEYEKLLRNIFDKPLNQKPILGTPPAFILEKEPIQVKTHNKLNNLKNAITTNNRSAKHCIQDYLDTLILALDDYKIQYTKQENFDDLFMENISNFMPYRDNFVEFSELVYNSFEPSEINEYLHQFFERLIPFKYPSVEIKQWNELDYDNFRFILYELFLYFISVLLKYKLYEPINFFLTEQYYSEIPFNNQYNIFTYSVFSASKIQTLDIRKKRLQQKWISMIAFTFEERARLKKYSFLNLLQTDLIIFLRTSLSLSKFDNIMDNPYVLWYPNLVKHGEIVQNGLEIFLRCRSKKYFKEFITILNISDKTELLSKWNNIRDKFKTDTFFDKWTTSFEKLMNLEELDTI